MRIGTLWWIRALCILSQISTMLMVNRQYIEQRISSQSDIDLQLTRGAGQLLTQIDLLALKTRPKSLHT